MRALTVLALGAVASWLVSGVFQVAFGLAVDAREEMVFALVVEVPIAVAVAVVFGIVLAAGGGRRGLAFTAIALVVGGGALLAGIEAFALADEAAMIDPSDFPLMLELGIPGVLTVLVQWWLVRRHWAQGAARTTGAVTTG